MDVVHNDDDTTGFLDEAGMSFMALIANELNKAMKENGVKSAEKRQEICSSFLFNVAYNLDAGWFMHENKKLFPKICFAERAEPQADENLGCITFIHVATEAISMHEASHGVVSQYFEDNETLLPPIKTGSYGNEN